VYIEDYYEIGGPSGTASKVQWKYNATTAHLAKAGRELADSLFITFSSAEQDYDVPPEYPRVRSRLSRPYGSCTNRRVQIIALGNNSDVGVNQKLLPYLRKTMGSRRGIVLMDWYAQVPGLVEGVIGL
jgi:1-phosphatidylinositol phosphodiesterase